MESCWFSSGSCQCCAWYLVGVPKKEVNKQPKSRDAEGGILRQTFDSSGNLLLPSSLNPHRSTSLVVEETGAQKGYATCPGSHSG